MPRTRESLFFDKSCLATIWQHHIVNPDIYFNGSGCKHINVRDLHKLTHARVGPILKSIIFSGLLVSMPALNLPCLTGHQTSSNIWGHQEEHLKSHEKTQLKLTDPSEISPFFSGPPTFLMDFLYICLAPQKKSFNGKKPQQTQTPPARGGVWNLGLCPFFVEWNEPPASNWLGPGPTFYGLGPKTERNLHTVIDFVWKKKYVCFREESDGLFFFSGHLSLRETKFDGLNRGIRTIDNGVIFLSEEWINLIYKYII